MDYFAYRKIKAWLKEAPEDRKRGEIRRMILGVLISNKEYVAIPIPFRTKVEITYCPVYNVSLN